MTAFGCIVQWIPASKKLFCTLYVYIKIDLELLLDYVCEGHYGVSDSYYDDTVSLVFTLYWYSVTIQSNKMFALSMLVLMINKQHTLYVYIEIDLELLLDDTVSLVFTLY